MARRKIRTSSGVFFAYFCAPGQKSEDPCRHFATAFAVLVFGQVQLVKAITGRSG
jgi:hypothetical protein